MRMEMAFRACFTRTAGPGFIHGESISDVWTFVNDMVYDRGGEVRDKVETMTVRRVGLGWLHVHVIGCQCGLRGKADPGWEI